MVGTPGCGLIRRSCSSGEYGSVEGCKVRSERPDTPEPRDVDQSQALTKPTTLTTRNGIAAATLLLGIVTLSAGLTPATAAEPQPAAEPHPSCEMNNGVQLLAALAP
jgi:hypothetical protein